MRVLIALLLAIGIAASQTNHPIVASFVLPLLAALAAAEIDRRSGVVSRTLVRLGARMLPRKDRHAFGAEWLDHVSEAGDQGILALTRALSILLIAVPLLAIGLRVGRRVKGRAE